MSIRDDKKDLDMAGASVPADTYGDVQKQERIARAEDQDEKKKADRKLTDEPGPDFRVASGGESREEHDLTTDSPRWGAEGESREERGYPREGDEGRGMSDAPSGTGINSGR